MIVEIPGLSERGSISKMNDVSPSNPISRDIIFGIKIISVCFDMFYIFFRQNLTIFQQFCVTLPEPRSSALSIDAMLQYTCTVRVALYYVVR